MNALSATKAAAVAAAILLSAGSAGAQYFGQNKIRYRTLDFKVLKTENFDIHYYDEFREAAVEAGRMAERWHARLSKALGWKLAPNQPLILYASHPDFRGTAIIPGHIGETVGGVTEGLRRRVVMPMGGPFAETDHVLGHELVHAFQFDMATRPGPGGGPGLPGLLGLPLWFVEGMAEYLSLGHVDPLTAMWLRDAVRREAVPSIRQLDHPRYFPYRYGHAFWSYVGGRYGDDAIGRILRAAGRGGGIEGAISSVLGISTEELSKEWHEALSDAYEPVLQATLPPRKQAELLISEERQGGELNVGPVLSPDGASVVFFSERDLYSIDMYLADANTGEIRRKLTETALDPHFDSMQFANSAGAWSRDGRRLVYGAFAGGRPELRIYDVQGGREARSIPLPDLDEVWNPSWSPDGSRIAFSAMVGGVTDLFVAEVRDAGAVRRLTNDMFADVQPSWSPDGRHIVFATDRFTSDLAALDFGEYRLALIDPVSGKIERVGGFDRGKHINPQWSPDGASIYFISDRDGIPNVYRLARRNGRIYQVTDLQTGVSGISRLSPAISVAADAGRLVFSGFEDGRYNIYRMDGAAAMAGRPPADKVARLYAATLPPRVREQPLVAGMLEQPRAGLASPGAFKREDYKPSLGLDYIAPPTVSVGMSGFGSLIGGGTAFYFSDLLGYHNLMAAVQTSTTTEGSHFFRNIAAMSGYQNQKRRWTWGVMGGQVPFLSAGYGRTLANVEGQPAVVEQAVTFWQIHREVAGTFAYPFNRAQRVEFSSGYQNISFAQEARIQAFSPVTGQLLLDQRRSLPTPPSLHLAANSAALVYDTSIFGGTSPILGQRYRFEFGTAAGSLNYSTLLGDYRRYFRVARPLTIAGRALHFGRYGGDAQDERLQDMFIGYPSLVRGYTPGSFTVDECPPAETGGCPAFDRLLGSRIGVVNLEARVPILGAFGVVPSRMLPPVEAALFYDAGVAWSRTDRLSVRGGSREPVSSYGGSLRINILGFAIGQISYVHPNDRPRKNWMWEFSLIPGF